MFVDQICKAYRLAWASIGIRIADWIWYWFGLPFRWARQIIGNGCDILRVLDMIHFRPLPVGLIDLKHPWVTGINPQTGNPIWPQNVLYRSPRSPDRSDLASDETVLLATGRFLATRASLSAALPEIPIGPRRRMPHAINYIHGSSHYNSGIIILNNLEDGYLHITDPRFRRELHRFVRIEKREILFLFRDRHYDPLEYAYFSCCMRTLFPWFCNPNGPRELVLWGNTSPFPAANLITGGWHRDVYQLNRADGSLRVVRSPIAAGAYLNNGPYLGSRRVARWPEKALAWITFLRIKIRGRKGGMFFIDRRKIYRDQIRNREARGLPDPPQYRIFRK